MPKVSADKLEPGMRLARSVTRGRLLLIAKGTELTEEYIEKIRAMGISAVYIWGPSHPAIPKEEALAQLDRRFRFVGNRPYMDLLKEVVREHIENLYD